MNLDEILPNVETVLRIIIVYVFGLISAVVLAWKWLRTPINKDIRRVKRGTVRRLNGLGRRLNRVNDEVKRVSSDLTALKERVDKQEVIDAMLSEQRNKYIGQFEQALVELDKMQLELQQAQLMIKQLEKLNE